MGKHVWKLDEDGTVDIFAMEYANHNGPECVECGYSFCRHCTPEKWESKCGDGYKPLNHPWVNDKKVGKE